MNLVSLSHSSHPLRVRNNRLSRRVLGPDDPDVQGPTRGGPDSILFLLFFPLKIQVSSKDFILGLSPLSL